MILFISLNVFGDFSFILASPVPNPSSGNTIFHPSCFNLYSSLSDFITAFASSTVSLKNALSFIDGSCLVGIPNATVLPSLFLVSRIDAWPALPLPIMLSPKT